MDVWLPRLASVGGRRTSLRGGKRGGLYDAAKKAREEVTGKKLSISSGPRRPDDPSALAADATRIRAALGWRSQYNDLKKIAESILGWERVLAENRKAGHK